jgi:hypothetical protein
MTRVMFYGDIYVHYKILKGASINTYVGVIEYAWKTNGKNIFKIMTIIS